MDGVSPETGPASQEYREVALTGTTIEGALDQLAKDAPGFNLERQTIQGLEDAAFEATRLAGRALSRSEENQFLKRANAIRRVMAFCRPNNSIKGVQEQEGKPVGLVVQVREIEGQK